MWNKRMRELVEIQTSVKALLTHSLAYFTRSLES